jgi:FkbM family methyltransferase
MTDAMERILIHGKWWLWLPTHRAARPEWTSSEGWERARMDCLHALIREHPVKRPLLYYVGAEEGDLAALCALWGAEVVLFEPNPLAWPHIRNIWEANGLSRPDCWLAFASDQDLPATDPEFVGPPHWSDAWPPCAYDSPRSDHGFRSLKDQSHRACQVRLDSVFGRPPDIIALDVEGAEWRVLWGAEKTLKEHHPDLVVSLHPAELLVSFGQHAGEFRRWLRDLGYTETFLEYPLHEAHFLYRYQKPVPRVE